MPAKRGTKRKAPATNGTEAATLSPPDRDTWAGWVEMESEPAFFNVMLKEMGARGVKVQEVYGLDDEMLAILPRPVHALIFLFRYRATDSIETEKSGCPSNVWFANQTPDFACATFALLNIINNIPGLELGKELREFKDLTHGMSPLQRGDAVDGFRFVKRIHNSFARESELLQAEVAMQQKFIKFKRRQTLAKAKATREANKVAKASPVQRPFNDPVDARKPGRAKKPTEKNGDDTADSDGNFDVKCKIKPDADTSEAAETTTPSNVRRSTRTPKPRKKDLAEENDAVLPDDDGFHFIAYMPIHGRVWKMDGLDKYPQDLGDFEDVGDWMHIAQPTLIGRMAQYEGADIEFNLMAVVHDPLEEDRQTLLENIKTIGAYDQKLDIVFEDWKELDGAETRSGTVTQAAPELAISSLDVDTTALPPATQAHIDTADLIDLVNERGRTIKRQPTLRAAVRDALEAAQGDDERARRRRHDLTGFVRGWLSALAEQDVLDELMSNAT